MYSIWISPSAAGSKWSLSHSVLSGVFEDEYNPNNTRYSHETSISYWMFWCWNFWPWDYFPKLLNYVDIQSNSFQIKGIIVYCIFKLCLQTYGEWNGHHCVVSCYSTFITWIIDLHTCNSGCVCIYCWVTFLFIQVTESPPNQLSFCYILHYLSSSSCSWRVRCVSCSLILKMKLVPPSLPRSSYVPSSFWFIL